jgi:D-alanyl-D-alanine carboxypeptidase/D-alanyl-D-alanine-endopeptidase (penicillin-binding protein 4)
MKTVYFVISLLFFNGTIGQSVNERIFKAIAELEKDKQFAHSIISLCVADEKTGKTVFEKNAQLGLAPASCQKIVTSAAAFELLGKDYRFKTPVKIYRSPDSVRLFIEGSGDPTPGSNRWQQTKMETVYKNIQFALKKKNISILGYGIIILENKFDHQPVPDGWVWQDIGNYYGAGARAFNWNENQYDLLLSSGNTEGDQTTVIGFNPASAKMTLSNYITTGKKGSGDQAYIYAAPNGNTGFATGTIPPSQSRFVISGSMPDPSKVFKNGLRNYLNENGISINEDDNLGFLLQSRDPASFETVYTIVSPSLDSINYWFLRKSVNLFGEAFVKTIALTKSGIGSTDTGIAIIKDLWRKKGIESSALNIIDGSGLSPANRVTTNALVKILQYAKSQPWFDSFKDALPFMNGIKMKDGYITGVRSYTGFIKSKNGAEYCFSFIVNNFDGNPATVREKMWKVLDVLK